MKMKNFLHNLYADKRCNIINENIFSSILKFSVLFIIENFNIKPLDETNFESNEEYLIFIYENVNKNNQDYIIDIMETFRDAEISFYRLNKYEPSYQKIIRYISKNF